MRVGFGERVAGLEDEVDRERARELACVLEQAAEVEALEQLHDHVRLAIRKRADVVDARDVLGLEANGGLGFADEALDVLGVELTSSRRILIATRSSSCEVARREHDAHAAKAERRLDAILAGDTNRAVVLCQLDDVGRRGDRELRRPLTSIVTCEAEKGLGCSGSHRCTPK